MKPIHNLGNAKIFSPFIEDNGLLKSTERIANMVATENEVILLIQDSTVTTRIVALNPRNYKVTTLFTETRGRKSETGVQCGTLAYYITPKGEERLVAQIQSTGSSSQGVYSINLIKLTRDPITGDLQNAGGGYTTDLSFNWCSERRSCYDIFCTEDGFVYRSGDDDTDSTGTLYISSYEGKSSRYITNLLNSGTTKLFRTTWVKEEHFYKVMADTSTIIISKHYLNPGAPLVGELIIDKSDIYYDDTTSPLHGMTIDGVCYILTDLGLFKFDDSLFHTSSGTTITPTKVGDVERADGCEWITDKDSTQILTRYKDYLMYPYSEFGFGLVNILDNSLQEVSHAHTILDVCAMNDTHIFSRTQPTGAFVIQSFDSRYTPGIGIKPNEKLTLHKCINELQDVRVAVQKHYNRLYSILTNNMSISNVTQTYTMNALLDIVEGALSVPIYTTGNTEILYAPNKTITLTTVNKEVSAGKYTCEFRGSITVTVGFMSTSTCSANGFTAKVRHTRNGVKVKDYTFSGPTTSASKAFSVSNIQYGDQLEVLGVLDVKCSNHAPTINFTNVRGTRVV